MATNQQQQGEGNSRAGRSPPRDRDVGLAEEMRVKLLIAKCFEDGITPENLCHGEFVMENGVKIFKVDENVGRLTTTWLKERVVTVIFQGAARDLPLKVRENLRAYENGWTRQRIFDRTVRRGRTHGEGPNIISYIAMTTEIAQWMVAKAEDKVVVGGVEYAMLFKPWMTRKELEDRRRVDEETKFWVIALRVPIRAAFHIHDMLEKSMGMVVKAYDAEPDKTRPKLMNRKYDLVKEAEGNFEQELPMKLEDGEVLTIKFVCKHTHWCDRCRWCFHTADNGCPRAEEEAEQDGAGGRSGGNFNFNPRTADFRSAGFQRGIEEAARDMQVRSGQRQQSAVQSGGRIPRGESSNQAQHSVLQTRGRGIAEQDPRGWQPQGGGTQQAQQMVGNNPIGGGPVGAFIPYVSSGLHPWQTQQAAGIWQHAHARQDSGRMMHQGGMIRPPGGLYPVAGYQDVRASGLEARNFAPQQQARGELNQERALVVRQADPNGEDRTSHEVIIREHQPPPPGMDIEEVNPLGKRKERERGASAATSEASTTQGGARTGINEQEGNSRWVIPEGVTTLERGEREREESFLLPFVCALHGQEIFVIGLKAQDGSMALPTVSIQGLATPEIIATQTRRIYNDRFQFRIFPEEMMAKLITDFPGGRRLKYAAPLIDARIPPECWNGLNNVGLECVRLNCFVTNEVAVLSQIAVDPRIPANFLAGLDMLLPRSRNLSSQYFVNALRGSWEETRLLRTDSEGGNHHASASAPAIG
ncbi:hypothetical protein CBR_g45405 [Chara braunii]|uniref:Uncharacterized protein n=1 Tax=Chara braunii TaxID=69332 RepID=A0A388LYJ8_CHABU|nr:hypothetical protein CBR_g45405 [Chara braunii]|eukprot:GBG87345.1 hypothetical protein CBR_g45405 [Chara braunii]